MKLLAYTKLRGNVFWFHGLQFCCPSAQALVLAISPLGQVEHIIAPSGLGAHGVHERSRAASSHPDINLIATPLCSSDHSGGHRRGVHVPTASL